MSSGTSLIGQVEIPNNTNLTKSLVSMVESDISAMELQLPDNEDSNNTGEIPAMMIITGPPPDMKGLFQHLTFHLWLFLPVLLLFVPSEPKFLEKCLEELLDKRNFELDPKFGWRSGTKLKIPLFPTFILAMSAFSGCLWALLHLYSNSVSWSIVGGILFWTLVFIFIAAARLIMLMREWLPTKFGPEIETFYTELCVPFLMEKSDMSKILSCMREIKTIKVGNDYVTEKMSRADSLSLVLYGRLLVRQSGKLLHVVSRLQFVDSPEWFGVVADDLFQVSATALEETKVLVWHRDKLKLTLMETPYLFTVFEHIIARDVVRKLAQSHEGTSLDHLDKAPILVVSASNPYEAPTFDPAHETPSAKNTLVMKNGSVQILGSVAPRHASNSWSLGRISETEDEDIISSM